jgi:hypothetical protein
LANFIVCIRERPVAAAAALEVGGAIARVRVGRNGRRVASEPPATRNPVLGGRYGEDEVEAIASGDRVAPVVWAPSPGLPENLGTTTQRPVGIIQVEERRGHRDVGIEGRRHQDPSDGRDQLERGAYREGPE